LTRLSWCCCCFCSGEVAMNRSCKRFYNLVGEKVDDLYNSVGEKFNDFIIQSAKKSRILIIQSVKKSTILSLSRWKSRRFYHSVGEKDKTTSGRCYDHSFMQFSPIFGQKIGKDRPILSGTLGKMSIQLGMMWYWHHSLRSRPRFEASCMLG
jgi:hypothetical protein